MNPIFVETAPRVPGTKGFEAHRLHVTDHVEVIHIALGPGQGLVRHAPPVDTLIYVVAGTATVEAGADKVVVPQGALLPNPARTMHRVVNESDSPLRFLVIKTPKPDRPPEFEN